MVAGAPIRAGGWRSALLPDLSSFPPHDASTRRSVWRRSFSCSLEQHQCRPSCRTSPHTTHSPAACRCRRSSGRLDHRASALKSHASAAFRTTTAAYPRSVARRCASFRQPACRLCSSATNGCPQISHGRLWIGSVRWLFAWRKDRRQLETPGRSHLAVRRARRQRLINSSCLRVRADGTDPRHLDKIPPKPTETGRPHILECPHVATPPTTTSPRRDPTARGGPLRRRGGSSSGQAREARALGGHPCAPSGVGGFGGFGTSRLNLNHIRARDVHVHVRQGYHRNRRNRRNRRQAIGVIMDTATTNCRRAA